MKRTLCAITLCLLTLAILTPWVGHVNTSLVDTPLLVADGSLPPPPFPPPPPPAPPSLGAFLG